MNLQKYLRIRSELEHKLCTLYTTLSETLDDEATAKLFGELSHEESAHGQSLEILARLAGTLKDKVEVPEKFAKPADRMRAFIDDLIGKCEQGRAPLPARVLELAIRIESCSLEAAGAEALGVTDPEFIRTFDMLHVADDTHIGRLKARLEALG